MTLESIKGKFPQRFSVAFTFLFVLLYWPGMLLLPYEGVFAHLEDVWQDRLFALHEDSLPHGDSRLLIAAMDEETGKKFGFPLPRSVHAKLLDKLRGYGVKTAVFDVMFFEPREGDRELAAATRRFKRVVHLFQTATKSTPVGDVVSVNLPIKGLAEASQFVGYPNIDRIIDDDGHVRRAMLFDERVHNPVRPKELAQSMDVAAIRSFLGKSYKEMAASYADPAPRVLMLKFRAPLRRMLRHKFRDEKRVGKVADLPEIDSPYQTLSVMDLLNGDLTADQKLALKGAVVVVGSTSLGYFDHYPTPFTPQAPGAEYHCNLMDNMLHGDFLRPVARGWILLAVLFMIWLPVLLLRVSPLAGSAIAAAVFVGWYLWGDWNFTRGVRIDFVAPLAALACAFLVQTVHRVLTEGQEKKFIKALFGQFVAPEVVEDLARDPGKVKLGGEKKEMTIFFLDIAHFTTISEKMTPEALIHFLNRYLSALSQVVHDQKGVVDKYIGDCIMAFWNAPIELADHRARACLAAIGCQELMRTLNLTQDSGLTEPPAIRIGLNSGQVTVGLTGSEKKLQYTVIGDEVNLASRLEGANKFFGSRIMASEATYDGARDVVEARELGRVRVVGKETPIRVFELLARKGELSPAWTQALPLYEKGVGHFAKREYAPAVRAFQDVLKIIPEDGPATLYLNAAKDYSAIPPDEHWDGVFNLTSK